ncbi:RNA polymerase II transcription mediator complex subunit 9-domain-containing protein [Geopyxis carbonaria]|nr:RNA polymerase II transcription mediator complex subunit 9-domain-containing protein [Geopyxis carbonaria]
MSTPNPLATAAAIQAAAPIPPNAFDFLPDLHVLLQRVYNDELDPKDVTHEANRIRLKIQKARNIVAELPQVNLTLEDQQKEIKELEEHIAKQRQILKSVAELDIVQEVVKRRGGKTGIDT